MVTEEVMQANDEVILTEFPDNHSPGRGCRFWRLHPPGGVYLAGIFLTPTRSYTDGSLGSVCSPRCAGCRIPPRPVRLLFEVRARLKGLGQVLLIFNEGRHNQP
jgi:hypothetical protein